MSENEFSAQYSEESFWDKSKKYAKNAGEMAIESGLKMYYAARDDDTPKWAKAAIFSALGYFICPVDAIPDLMPVLGFSDDLGVLVAAAATTAAYIKDEHVAKAKETVKQWFAK
jgi:uncharacterized membrane protein YkvA (DUF1232 family)